MTQRGASLSDSVAGCAACRGPHHGTTPEQLWFYGHDVGAGDRIAAALRAEGLLIGADGEYVIATTAGATSLAIERVVSVLDEIERRSERVVWLVSGNAPTRDANEGLTLEHLQAEIRRGASAWLLDEGRLYMHFQPIVSLGDRRVYAHEALVRAKRDGRELSGFEVITNATEAGLLIPLDARTRRTAIAQFAETGLEGKLFINFQPSAIYNPRFCLRTTFEALERSALSAADLVFEVVESEEIPDFDHLMRIFEVYRAHGVGVALDDFGAGYSDSGRLLQLHPDFVKIDKELTKCVATEVSARDRVAEVLRMAAAEGCTVIAEGIESVTQRDILGELGCELDQGYLFARPSLHPVVTWPE